MSMNESNQDDALSSAPPAVGGGNGSRRRARKKKKNLGSSNSAGSSKSSPAPSLRQSGDGSPLKVDSGYKDGDQVLESLNLSISGRIEQVMYSPTTGGYFKMVDVAYSELTALKSQASSILSLAEWRHCHALMLYARMSNCQFEATGFKQPAPTRISLPVDLRVFQPIFSILADLGIVEDPGLFVKYVPVALLPTEDEPSLEEVLGVVDCTHWPWLRSWENVLTARKTRQKTLETDKNSYSFQSGPAMDVATFKDMRNKLAETICDLQLVKRNDSLFFADPISSLTATESAQLRLLAASLNQLSWDGAKLETRDGVEITADSLESVIHQTYSAAANLKKERFRPNLTTLQVAPLEYEWENGDTSLDPGAYGRRLGWDPQLWKDYMDFVCVLERAAMFSMSFPKETKGTYSWLLPVHQDSSGFFVKMPKALPTPEWVEALILDASTLEAPRVSTWYGETDRLQYPDAVRVKYVKRAIKGGLAVEEFR